MPYKTNQKTIDYYDTEDNSLPCKAINNRGNPCRRQALRGKEFCLSHAPERKGTVRAIIEAAVAGRKAKRPMPDFGVLPASLATLPDILDTLHWTMVNLLEGKIKAREASTIGHLCNTAIRALESNKAATKMAAIRVKFLARDNDGNPIDI